MSLPHLLLGLLAEPASGYDLKRIFDSTARHFWAAELSQIYPTLQALERDGQLKVRDVTSSSGPNRRVYQRTARGTKALHDWVRQDPVPATIRLPFLGQLAFLGELNDPAATTRFLTTLRTRFQERLATLRMIETKFFPDPDALSFGDFHAHLTVVHGIARLESACAWCDVSLTRLARRPNKERSNDPPHPFRAANHAGSADARRTSVARRRPGRRKPR